MTVADGNRHIKKLKVADIMETNPDNSPISIPLPEMFHMD